MWNNGGGGNPYDDNPEEDPSNEAPMSDPIEGGVKEPLVDWTTLDPSEADKIEESADDGICNHEDHKQVFTKQQSAGVTIMGTGANGGRSVEKVYCSKCDKTWRLSDDDASPPSNQFGMDF